MLDQDSLESRQKSEYEALDAIYGEDLIDLRTKSVWNKWSPLNLSVKLAPQQGHSGHHEVFVKVNLHLKCTMYYPNQIPEIMLEESKGLSSSVLKLLGKELEFKAESLKGEEMILQLCQHTQEFLHGHNKPASKSFYEEMLLRQREKEELNKQAEQIEEETRRQSMLEEINRREDMLKCESKLRKDYRCNSEDSIEGDSGIGRRNSVSTYRNSNNSESSDDSLCMQKGTMSIPFLNNGFKEILRGRCIKHSKENCIVYNGIDKETGDSVIVHEWLLKSNNESDLSQLQRQISSIENEFNYIVKLKHQNLCHYKYIVSNKMDNEIIVHTSKEFVFGSNCTSLFLTQNIKVDIQFLKHLAKGILQGLDYLHRNNVVHREIKDSCVYINDKGGIQISNYSIHRRMSDLLTSISSQISYNYSKKNDIYKFGNLLISLLQGSSSNDSKIPNSIPSDLYDFLTRCLAKDDRERYTAAQLLNHSFLNDKPMVQFEQILGMEELIPDIPQDILDREIMSSSNSQSRIDNEFEILHHLGKGAFGDVIKFRNKLDGRYYAIKRIKLNPRNKQLNKKIVREVQLLSRLNHENVVRYYNSWIETTTMKEHDLDSARSSSESFTNARTVVKHDEFTLNDNIEELVPPIRNIEFSVTYDSKSQAAYETSSDDDSSEDDDETLWQTNFSKESKSDGIEFEEIESVSKASDNLSIKSTDKPFINLNQIDFMYIQMEFCEKSTLRNAIDNNLYLEEARLRRLFREIVEGLAHIHQQGMIHRDLKPVNIFLDSQDHVKIGDFGLATTTIKSKLNEYILTKSAIENLREDTGATDESKTGHIGTTLYVAPELTSTAKAVYNEKVDIYSLGIILFEMCYIPLSTTMERIKILNGVRKKDVVLPDDLNSSQVAKQELLIRWLLEHDVSKRPTSSELLQSEHIPPPVLEECELRELVRHTLSNPQMKGYKYLIASCFKQSLTAAQDLTYDRDPCSSTFIKHLPIYELIKQKVINIFKIHGGQNLPTPLLMPTSSFYGNVDTYVRLMTHFGGIVTLPYDLRVPFARYTAWNHLTLFRRFTVERVYRERKVFGFLPRELYECAFDIVTPTPGNLMSDAEILYIVYETIEALPSLNKRNFLIRLNHTKLIRAILLYCGIKDNHNELITMFSDFKEDKIPKYQLQLYLYSLGLSDNYITTFFNYFNSESEFSKAAIKFQMITKKKSSEAGQLANQALQDLKTIVQNAEAFGVTFDIVIAPGLVYNVQQYSGMICQFVSEIKKKHKHNIMEVLAAGGRYDSMIAGYRNIMEKSNIPCKGQSAVGISISLDKLVQAVLKEQYQIANNDILSSAYLDVVVCSLGNKQFVKEKTKILRNLWSVNIRCFLIDANNAEDIDELCQELKVPHVIMLKDSEHGSVILRSWEKDKRQDMSLSIDELLKNMPRIIKQRMERQHESNPSQIVISRSDSKIASHYNEPTISIIFVTLDKLSSNAKKRYENQISSNLSSLFKRLVGYVVVLGINTEVNIIRTLASHIECDTEEMFQTSLQSIIEKHQKHKKYISKICDEIYTHKSKSTKPLLVLYSLIDYRYKLID